MDPVNPIGCFFRIYTHKSISYKDKDLINKLKFFTEIKKLTKFSWLEYTQNVDQIYKCTNMIYIIKNLGLQNLGIFRQQTPSLLVSVEAQHSHFHQVLLSILYH